MVLLACPATKSSHGGLTSTLSDGLPPRSPPADAQEWSRTDRRVCVFQGPTSGRPGLQHVVWRRTVSLPDGQVIQDLPVTSDISCNRMFCPIGFTGDVRTTFWSYPVKRAAWNALRPNIYTDGHDQTVQINDSAMVEYIVIADDNMKRSLTCPRSLATHLILTPESSRTLQRLPLSGRLRRPFSVHCPCRSRSPLIRRANTSNLNRFEGA